MKISILFSIIFLFFNCQYKKDTTNKSDAVKDTIKNEKSNNCSLTALKFGESFLKNEITLYDMSRCDNLLLTVVDTLLSAPQNEQLFWFAVLSKIAPQTDGYLAEGFGSMAYKFVEKQPLQFTKNLIGIQKEFSLETNIENWVNQVFGEISIAYENIEKEQVEKYINSLKKESSSFNLKEKNAINSFCKKLKTKV
jgi:hypothetical protein